MARSQTLPPEIVVLEQPTSDPRAEIQRALVYPPGLIAESVEGVVVVQVVVEVKRDRRDPRHGRVVGKPVCLRAPDERLCPAAIEAVRGVQFTPGNPSGRDHKMRLSVPVRFALPDDE